MAMNLDPMMDFLVGAVDGFAKTAGGVVTAGSNGLGALSEMAFSAFQGTSEPVSSVEASIEPAVQVAPNFMVVEPAAEVSPTVAFEQALSNTVNHLPESVRGMVDNIRDSMHHFSEQADMQDRNATHLNTLVAVNNQGQMVQTAGQGIS